MATVTNKPFYIRMYTNWGTILRTFLYSSKFVSKARMRFVLCGYGSVRSGYQDRARNLQRRTGSVAWLQLQHHSYSYRCHGEGGRHHRQSRTVRALQQDTVACERLQEVFAGAGGADVYKNKGRNRITGHAPSAGSCNRRNASGYARCAGSCGRARGTTGHVSGAGSCGRRGTTTHTPGAIP